jgi:threonine/homoserine/homoserine lactone efflux protein
MTPARIAVLGAVWLAAFAVLFSAGSAFGAWPPPPEGFLRGSDLAAGLVFGGVLLATFLRPGRRSPVG